MINETETIISTVVNMTAAEAKAQHEKIWQTYKEAEATVGSLLVEMRERRGFEKLGFATFDEYVRGTFEESRATIYRLIQVAEVSKNVGVKTLPVRQASLLAQLPAEAQREVYQTVAPTGAAVPSEAIVRQAVERRKPKKAPKKAVVAGWTKDQIAADKDLDAAFQKIQSVYGKPDTDDLRNGKVETIKRADVIQLSKLPHDKMVMVQDLIFANDWTAQECLDFLSRQPTLETTLEEMQNYCLAQKGYTTATIGGFEFTCKAKHAFKRK